MLRFITIVFLILAFNLVLFGQNEKESKNKIADNYSANFLDGTAFELKDFKGKIIVINLWYVGCPPCVEEIPKLNKLVETYKEKDVIFLALTVDPEIVLNKFLKKNPFKYQIVPNALDLTLKHYGKSEKGGRIAIPFPTHIVINEDFEIVVRTFGQSGIKGVKKFLRKKFKKEKKTK